MFAAYVQAAAHVRPRPKVARLLWWRPVKKSMEGSAARKSGPSSKAHYTHARTYTPRHKMNRFIWRKIYFELRVKMATLQAPISSPVCIGLWWLLRHFEAEIPLLLMEQTLSNSDTYPDKYGTVKLKCWRSHPQSLKRIDSKSIIFYPDTHTNARPAMSRDYGLLRCTVT